MIVSNEETATAAAAACTLLHMRIDKSIKLRYCAVSSRIQTFVALIIHHMLDGQAYKEAELRKRFGNTPDVSKAVRCMLKAGSITKTGSGGRWSPYIYRFVRL
jgi:cobalamin biosynthesis protein CbiD